MITFCIFIIVGTVIFLLSFIRLAPQFGQRPESKRMEMLAKKAVYSNGRFHNAHELPVMQPGSLLQLIKASQVDKEFRRPVKPLPFVYPSSGKTDNDSAFSAIWMGHSSVYIHVRGITILTDPVFLRRASPVSFIGPRSFRFENPVSPDDLPVPDIILISHDHFDHLDYKTIRKYFLKVRLYIVPLGIRDHLEKWGVKPEQIIEFDWWQKEIVLDKLTITATPSQHFSGRRGQNNSTLWCSWVIQIGEYKIFFSGDSGYADHFKNIGEKLGPFNFACMECGAYGKFWPFIHMLPEQSVQAGIDIKAEVVMPVHWGKFNLAHHPWNEPVRRFVDAAEAKGLNYVIPFPGETLNLGMDLPIRDWWNQ